jgi:hypothetical protein
MSRIEVELRLNIPPSVIAEQYRDALATVVGEDRKAQTRLAARLQAVIQTLVTTQTVALLRATHGTLFPADLTVQALAEELTAEPLEAEAEVQHTLDALFSVQHVRYGEAPAELEMVVQALCDAGGLSAHHTASMQDWARVRREAYAQDAILREASQHPERRHLGRAIAERFCRSLGRQVARYIDPRGEVVEEDALRVAWEAWVPEQADLLPSTQRHLIFYEFWSVRAPLREMAPSLPTEWWHDDNNE